MQRLGVKHKAVMLLSSGFILLPLSITAETSAEKIYEIRTYTSAPGKLDELHARFRDHTSCLFAKHSMRVIGYWVSVDNELSKTTLMYILEHANTEAAQSSWKAFGQDPEWQTIGETSNANGAILINIESSFMTATDYSPIR